MLPSAKRDSNLTSRRRRLSEGSCPGPEVAEHWHESLWQTVGLLKTSPFIGRKGTALKHPGIRSWRVEHFTRWLIFYALKEDALVLYRVRSGTMNLAALRLVS